MSNVLKHRSITRSSPKSLYSDSNHCPKLSPLQSSRSGPRSYWADLLSGSNLSVVSLTGWSGARTTFLECSPPWLYISKPSLWSGLLTQVRLALNSCSLSPLSRPWPLFSGFWPHSGPPSYSFRLIAAHPSNPIPGKTSLTLTNTLAWLHFFSPSSTLAWLYQLLNGPHAPDCKPHLTGSHFPLTPGLAYSTLKKKQKQKKNEKSVG